MLTAEAGLESERLGLERVQKVEWEKGEGELIQL